MIIMIMAFRLSFCLVLLALCLSSTPGEARWDELEHIVVDMSVEEGFAARWNNWIQQWLKWFRGEIIPNGKFPCDTTNTKFSHEPPTSVHKLHPSDIQVIGALGDSLTAANGANVGEGIILDGVIQVLREYRGFSWSSGGFKSFRRGVTTIPNIIKEYNKDLVGYATVRAGTVNNPGAQLNVAVPGQKAPDMPDQAWDLVEKMKLRTDVNMKEDWKMVTIFIGGNDLCAWCNDKEKYGVESYVANIQTALDILHDNLPRTFVNVVAMFDLATPISEGLAEGYVCKAIHWALCKCAVKKMNTRRLKKIARGYGEGVEALIATGRYDTKDDFTVVFQPVWQDTELPKLPNGDFDRSLFAPDCFHFSSHGQAEAALMLWKAMFEPVGKKSRSIPFDTDLVCPSKMEYFATSKNSKP